MRFRIHYIIFLLLFSIPNLLVAQQEDTLATEEPEIVQRCLSVEDLQRLMHIKFSDAVFFLEEKGYQLGFSFSANDAVRRDSLYHVELKYTTKSFNNIADPRSLVRIYFSEDGLCNIVEDFRPADDECSLNSTFRAHPFYREDRQNKLFVGNNPDGMKIEEYIVRYVESDGRLHIVMANETERNTFAERRYKEFCDIMLDRLSDASLMARYNHFLDALKQLDSIDKRFVTNDTVLPNMRGRIVANAENYYFPLILTVANKENDIEKALRICDTLDAISPRHDSIQHIYRVLRGLESGTQKFYSTYHPDVYDSIVNSLRTLVNNEIRENLTDDPQHLRVNFTFHTEKENLSTYDVNLWPEKNTRPQNLQLVQKRLSALDTRINTISKSELIQPVTEYGIIVTTHQPLNAEVSWFFFKEKIINECPIGKTDYQPFVNQIENDFFTTKKVQHTVKGDTVILRRRLPSNREYTFGVTHKTYNNKLLIDVTLDDFKTPGPLSWMPSLIIPGLGTNRQGEPHSVAARAVPFYLCAGFAAWGLIYEKTHTTNRFDWDDSDQHMLWEYKNFGYWTAAFFGTFAVSIYITDLVQGISNSINNVKRTKTLRQELKKGHITLQSQDVILWPSDDNQKTL